MKEMKRAVAYARFSSNMQREESIDAQLRAIHTYADAHGLMIVDEYIDRAVSGTSDRRTEFQRMIADSGQKKFEVIIVHKLDRFARSRYDSAHYKFQLKRNAVQLMSVSENLDDSPEATILESVLEGMAEYYSKNLAREVEKGKKENALQGRHVGGVPPLGYAVDPDTKRLVICPEEAEAVRLIFRLFLEGTGYIKIRDTLNARGYKTRRGNSFGKNSLHEILRNEKYTGTYIYNKSASKSVDGHYNRHAYKDEEDVIRVEGLVPAIISRDDYEAVQEKLAARRHRGGAKKAAEPYLLSGRVRCGCCGSAYVGNHRKAYSDHIAYSSYRCSKKNQAIRCPSREIERYSLEQKILQLLAERVFDDRLLPQLEKSYISFLEKRMQDTDGYQARLKKRREEVEQQISNLVAVIATTASVSLSAKLRDLEQELMQIQSQQAEQEALNREKHLAGNALKAAFYHAKKMLALGTLENKQALVERFVKEVVIYSDHVDVKLNIIGGFQFTEKIQRS